MSCYASPKTKPGTGLCICPVDLACKCGVDPVCLVHDGVSTPVWKNLGPVSNRPRKTPLFVPPAGPIGYSLERKGLDHSPETRWISVSSFYDEFRRKRVDVLKYYDSEITANKVAKRMRETSWHKDVRVVPHWATEQERKAANPPPTVKQMLKDAGKWEINDAGYVVAQIPDPPPAAIEGVIEVLSLAMGKSAAMTLNSFVDKYMDDVFSEPPEAKP